MDICCTIFIYIPYMCVRVRCAEGGQVERGPEADRDLHQQHALFCAVCTTGW